MHGSSFGDSRLSANMKFCFAFRMSLYRNAQRPLARLFRRVEPKHPRNANLSLLVPSLRLPLSCVLFFFFSRSYSTLLNVTWSARAARNLDEFSSRRNSNS